MHRCRASITTPTPSALIASLDHVHAGGGKVRYIRINGELIAIDGERHRALCAATPSSCPMNLLRASVHSSQN